MLAAVAIRRDEHTSSGLRQQASRCWDSEAARRMQARALVEAVLCSSHTLRECEQPVTVLHAFQKKSKAGIATPKPDLDLIRRRLKVAENDYKERHGKVDKRGYGMTELPDDAANDVAVVESSGSA